jgi:hypothetical protein
MRSFMIFTPHQTLGDKERIRLLSHVAGVGEKRNFGGET